MIGPEYRYRATCLRVVDGDTLELDVDLGFTVRARISARLRGVNAPEVREPGGSEATAYLSKLVTGRQLIVQSYRDRRSFARWVCDVWLEESGESVAEALIAAGVAAVGRA